MKKLLILLLMVFPFSAHAIDIYEFETAAQEKQYRQLITELRCPKCQNQSIGDSDADIAADMRRKTAQLINEGHSNDEVVEYFRARYGDFVSYRPPINWSTVALWFGPALILLLGALIVFSSLRKAAKRSTDDEDEVTQ